MEEVRTRSLVTGPEQLYVDLTSMVAGLAETVACVALHLQINAVIADAADVERAAEALRAVTTGRAGEGVGSQSTCDVSSVETVISDDAKVSVKAEVATTVISLRRNGWIDDARQSEMDVVDELCAVRSGLAKVEPAHAMPKDVSCLAQNGIATRVLELHDRLGGFINPKSSPRSR